MKLTEAWIAEAIAPALEGVELVAFEELGGRRHRVVRVYVDHPGGVTHEVCAAVSSALSEALDRTSYSDGPYSLEVSSPGLERPLRRREHFEAQMGKKVYVKTKRPIAGQKVRRGELLGVEEHRITIRDESGEVEIALDEIAEAHLVYEFK